MISAQKRKQIRLLLRKGLPRKEVAKRAGVSNKTVNNIVRLLEKPRVVPPCLTCHVSEAPELLRIVNDLQELHKLALIPHPLFKELAHRARESLKKISLGSM